MTQKELEQLIVYHQNKYYNSEPEIEDWEFDELWDTLVAEYPESELLKKVGDEGKTNDNKVKHIIHMGSQEKINTYDGIQNWIRLKNIKFPIIIEEKLDGISLELVYNDGKLLRAVTRGNGFVGKDITDNVKLMDIPQEIVEKGFVVIRGEILLPFSNVSKLVGFDEIKNVRNIASGIANQKDSKENLNLLTVVCYDVYSDSPENSKIAFLQAMGFKVPTYHFYANNYDEIINYIENIKVSRDNKAFDYQIDGAVMKQDVLPEDADTDKARPDWQRAFKYPVEKVVTKLIDVEWSRNGYNFTPVALLEPVEICDTTVSRASLANYGELKRLGIKVPCTVEVAKQNEIIPKVHSVVDRSGECVFPHPPKYCPICGEPLVISDTLIQCVNPLCSSRVEHRIRKWIDSVGALGFGDAMIEYLVFDCNIKHISELYCNEIVAHATENAKSPKNVEKAFADLWARSKNLNLWDFVGGFDIEGIGSKVVKLIVDAGYNSIDSLRQVNYEELINIDGFGESRANLFVEQIKMISDEIDAVLKTNRVTIKSVEKVVSENQLVFCITGTLSRPRKEYEQLIISKGHKLASSVTKKTNYLVNNDIDSDSTKNQAAKKNGIPIITEEEFLGIING